MVQAIVGMVVLVFVALVIWEIILPFVTNRSIFPSLRLKQLRKQLQQANDEGDKEALRDEIEKIEKDVEEKKHHKKTRSLEEADDRETFG